MSSHGFTFHLFSATNNILLSRRATIYFFILSSEEHLGIYNTKILDTSGCNFLYMSRYMNFRYMSRSAVAGSEERRIFRFLRNCQAVFQRQYHFVFPSTMDESSCCSTPSPVFSIESLPYYGHSNMCVVLSFF